MLNRWGFSILVLVVGVALDPTSGASSARWNEMNCPSGSVTDFVCCQDKSCESLDDESSCHAEAACLWNGEKCKMNRDDRNNVCCSSPVNDVCDAVTKGKCPSSYQVPSGCCTKPGLRWEGILTVNKTGFVCCNAPCTDLEKMECEVPPSCNERNFGPGVGPSSLGFRHGFIHNNFHLGQQIPGLHFRGSGYGPIGPGGYAGPNGYGPGGYGLQGGGYGGGYGFGFGHSYSGAFPGKGIHDDDYSKDRHTKEITADDVLTAMIDALSHDDDVFTVSKELHSDPVFGKEEFGGLIDNFNFADPEIFFDSIYGLPLTYGGGYYGHGNLGGYGGFGFGHQKFGSEYGAGHGGFKGHHGGHHGGGYGGSHGGHHRSGYGARVAAKSAN